MTLTERVANFMPTSQPGDAIAPSKDGDVETVTGVLLLRCQEGLEVLLCYRQPVSGDFDASLILRSADVLCRAIGTILDS